MYARLGCSIGLLSFFFLHVKPVRGDVFLAGELGIATSLWILLAFDDSRTALVFEFVTVQISVLAGLTALYRISPLHPLYGFPGPWLYRLSNAFYAGLVMTGWRHRVIQDLHRRSGTFVRIGPNTLSLNSKAAVSPIYSSSRCFDRSDAYRLQTLPGDGLFFVTDRDIHHARRNRWGPAFTSSNLARYQPVLQRRTLELTDCMESRLMDNGCVDLSQCIEHWSYDFMGDFAFGKYSPLELMRNGDAEGLVSNGKTATAVFDILGEIPWMLDILWYFPLTSSIRQLHSLARGLVLQHRKETDAEAFDILSYLSTETDETDGISPLTEAEKVMDAVFAIQAGSDTSANVLQYTFFFIITSPSTYKKLQEELDEAFPDPSAPLDFDILAELPFLNAVINEGLRLGTPLSGLQRVTPSEGVSIDDTFIPGGTIVSVPAFTQQHDPANFSPRPDDFLPERWLPGGLGVDTVADMNAIMSFSFGPYGCIGRTLAIQELRIVIARLLLKFEMKPPPRFDAEAYRRSIRNVRTTFFPSNLMVHVSPRY